MFDALGLSHFLILTSILVKSHSAYSVAVPVIAQCVWRKTHHGGLIPLEIHDCRHRRNHELRNRILCPLPTSSSSFLGNCFIPPHPLEPWTLSPFLRPSWSSFLFHWENSTSSTLNLLHIVKSIIISQLTYLRTSFWKYFLHLLPRHHAVLVFLQPYWPLLLSHFGGYHFTAQPLTIRMLKGSIHGSLFCFHSFFCQRHPVLWLYIPTYSEDANIYCSSLAVSQNSRLWGCLFTWIFPLNM